MIMPLDIGIQTHISAIVNRQCLHGYSFLVMMKNFYDALKFYFFVVYCTKTSACACSVGYLPISEIENKIGTKHLLNTLHAESLLFCAAQCLKNCSCFGYHRGMKLCRLHAVCDVNGIVTEEFGWWYYRTSQNTVDCLELYQRGQTCSRVYTIYPGGVKSNVLCNMEISGGGWTVIQNRFDGSLDFKRTWTDYKHGFGSPIGEYWIGNEVIYELTKDLASSLYVSITLTNGTTIFQQYETFAIANEQDNYRLYLAGDSFGTLGDRMTKTAVGDILNGMMFSTKDRDHDNHPDRCASGNGGWWFNKCHDAYLNGPYGSSSWVQPWYPLIRDGTLIRETMMMIKRG